MTNSKKQVFKQVDVERFKEDLFHQYGMKTNMVTDLDGKAIQTAYDKIIEIWNKDEKSQSFIKHLINAFLPYGPLNSMMNAKEGEIYKCSILGHRITSVKNVAELYSEISMKKMGMSAKAMTENRDNLTESEMKILNAIRDRAQPEVRRANIAMMSDKSTKFLQRESVVALQHFCANMILFENRTLLYVQRVHDFSFKSDKPKLPTKPTKLQVSVENHVDSKSLAALTSLKEKLSNN